MRGAGIKLFAASEQNLHVASDETLSGRKTYTTRVTLINTPSVLNYKISQESWRVEAISNLTKIIEKNIKIYDIKLMYYENITNKKFNGT